MPYAHQVLNGDRALDLDVDQGRCHKCTLPALLKQLIAMGRGHIGQLPVGDLPEVLTLQSERPQRKEVEFVSGLPAPGSRVQSFFASSS